MTLAILLDTLGSLGRAPAPGLAPTKSGVPVVSALIDPNNGTAAGPLDPRLRLHLLNSGGSDYTATLRGASCPKCHFITDHPVTVAAGSEVLVAGLPVAPLVQADGSVFIDYSAGAVGSIYLEPPQ